MSEQHKIQIAQRNAGEAVVIQDLERKGLVAPASDQNKGARHHMLVTTAARDVLAERQRQIHAEGWTPQHDDDHKAGELARAAGLYASNAGTAMHFGTTDTTICENTPYGWPWACEWWKPKNARHDLVKAAALILAEIERMDRAGAKGGAA